MKLIAWNKVSKMLAPEYADLYEGYLLVLGSKIDSSAAVRANYRTLKDQLTQAIEVKNQNASYLLIKADSSQKQQAEELVQKISTEEFLDTKIYQEELDLSNLHHHKPVVNCSLCYKPLSSERSVQSNLGPICEHRVNNIVEQDSEVPTEWTSIYVDPVESGELLWLKTKMGVILAEVFQINQDKMLLIDRKGLTKALKDSNDYTKTLEQYLVELPVDEIEGINRLAPKKVENKLFDDLMGLIK